MTGAERALRAILRDTYWGVVVAFEPAPQGLFMLSQAFQVAGIKKACGAMAIAENGSRPAMFLHDTTLREVKRVAALSNSQFWVSPEKFRVGEHTRLTDMETLEVSPSDDDSYFIICQRTTFPLDPFTPDLKPTGTFSVGWKDED